MERIEGCIFLLFELPLLFSLHLSLKVKSSDHQIYISFKQQSPLHPHSMRIDEAWRGIVCFTFMKYVPVDMAADTLDTATHM